MLIARRKAMVLLVTATTVISIGVVWPGNAVGDGNATYGCNLPSRSGTYWDAWYTNLVQAPASPDHAAKIDARGNNDGIVCQLEYVPSGEWTRRLTDNTG